MGGTVCGGCAEPLSGSRIWVNLYRTEVMSGDPNEVINNLRNKYILNSGTIIIVTPNFSNGNLEEYAWDVVQYDNPEVKVRARKILRGEEELERRVVNILEYAKPHTTKQIIAAHVASEEVRKIIKRYLFSTTNLSLFGFDF